MGNERTFVGLDVHARSVTGHALDAVTGEVWQRKLCPDPGEVLRWVSGLPGPVKVGYEADPTGYACIAVSMIMEPCVSWRRHRSCTGRTGIG